MRSCVKMLSVENCTLKMMWNKGDTPIRFVFQQNQKVHVYVHVQSTVKLLILAATAQLFLPDDFTIVLHASTVLLAVIES